MIYYNAFKFDSVNELKAVIEDAGFTFTPTGNKNYYLFKANGKTIDLHYYGRVITNFPETENWTPTKSTFIVIMTASDWEIILPVKHRLTTAQRKYYHNYINHYAGEAEPI